MAEPVLHALAEAAANATGAVHAWIVRLDGDTLTVVAASGPQAATVLGASVPAGSGTVGFSVASGQPLALSMRPDDPRVAEGVAALAGIRPACVVAVPCTTDDGVVGAVEIMDKAGAISFTFDDVELVTLLAGVAAPALVASGRAPALPGPDAVAARVRTLAASDPARYASVAPAIIALLGGV